MLRATQQLEREGKAGQKREGGRCQSEASLWSQQPPATELGEGNRKLGDSDGEEVLGWRAVCAPSPFDGC